MTEKEIPKDLYRCRQALEGAPVVDEVSAGDLDLDGLFRGLDRTITTAGGSCLYRYLRRPCASAAELSARLGLVRAFAHDGAGAAKARACLGRIGVQKAGSLVEEIYDQGPMAYAGYRGYLYAWAAFALGAIALSILAGFYIPFVVLSVLVANIVINSKTTGVISSHAYSVFYLCLLVRQARPLLSVLEGMGAEAEAASLRRAEAALRKIPRQAVFFRAGGGSSGELADMLFEYFRIFLLQELFAYFKVYAAFKVHRKEIAELYDTIGRMDFSLAYLSRMEEGGLGPALLSETTKVVDAVDLIHPAVPACVPNTVRIERGLVITGSNMAGKSTFLKALGVNQVAASSLGLCWARSFSSGFYLVMTSMNLADDLPGGRSRYLVEAERVMAVIREAEARPILALVDEILVGTNSEDRIQASIRILRRLGSGRSMAIAATHDLAIAEALKDDCGLSHFTERIGAGDLVFDYVIKPGVVDKRNALTILRHLGFPGELLGLDDEDSGAG
jgi:DNA mismatch repair ATPase MutS